MKISLFDYNLPKELIAQQQIKPRDHSRLLILDKAKNKIAHKHFYDLVDYLTTNDVLVVNETKVFPARLYGHKKTGGKVEVLLTEKQTKGNWLALIGARNLKIGDSIYFDKKLEAKIIKDIDGKTKQIKFNIAGKKLETIIDNIGHTPLPPYIKTKDSAKIKKDYQTVYAKSSGSAAAPTAGLHFTDRVLKKLAKQGVKIFKVTLHVGLGTFAPVEVKDIKKHQIHHEWASIDKKTADNLNKLKKQGKNIIAIGTTSARTLEAFSTKTSQLKSGSKWVDIYIYPGYKYKFVDDLLTNFHLPKSSLLFMVSALASRELILKAYKKAVAKKYRFFSFGDAMLITRDRL
ncbi:MAG: tRNA preQ1(34) S-adenosylmethionine ribosyltransferase-isomerase QueA [Candidatus Komeilibacteria bacterium]|jgi:S-adenosylmethionine:tRNA ribosyltransferase-isomerase|nr:tRNA preQ1(34) S-adenosylmethionine ribosyltransferase-isomerase QueA [Candidatus Komeilibacteria bacterium]MBT4447522.1 tRNA preQ1(34) S-adenosylmethionine ribosyltransferase-isomerase QueA [Candidatus Komeilibacteria bacterium]